MTLLEQVQMLPKKKRPNLKIGQTVRIHHKIKEGEKERIQIFEGIIIKMNHGQGADKTFIVRKIVEGVGVEKIFPLYSPIIEKIEIKKESKVRRSKLYYMRGRSGKSARLKGTMVEDEEAIDEAVAAQAEKEKQAAKEEAAQPEEQKA